MVEAEAENIYSLRPVDVVSGAHGFNKEVSTVPIKSRTCNSFRRKRAPRVRLHSHLPFDLLF